MGRDREETRPWIAPHLGAPGFTVALAELDGEPVATAYSIRTDAAARVYARLGFVDAGALDVFSEA